MIMICLQLIFINYKERKKSLKVIKEAETNCLKQNLQPWTKYLRKTLILCEIAHYGKIITVFQQFFANINKIFFWEED